MYYDSQRTIVCYDYKVSIERKCSEGVFCVQINNKAKKSILNRIFKQNKTECNFVIKSRIYI